MVDEKRVQQHINGLKHASFPQWMNLLGKIQWLDYKHSNIKKYVILESLFVQLRGEWETAVLDDGESLKVACGEYSATLDLERVYEEVAIPRI